MVTQATTESTTTSLPPCSRDFEAFRLVKVEKKSTRAVSKLLRISQTRVCQVIARVGAYMVDVTEPETDARREKQLAVAKQIAAEEINYCKKLALDSYHESRTEVRVVREIETPGQPNVRQTTTRQCFGETRYLNTFARLALISSSLPICNLPVTARRSADEIQAEIEDCEVKSKVTSPTTAPSEEIESPSKEACSADAGEQVMAELKLPKTDAEKLEAIKLYNRGMRMLNLPEQQIPETVHPAESTLPFAQGKLSKLERKRLRRDQRKQRSAIASS